MNVYIWSRLKHLTNNWHPEGGLVIVASDLAAARTMHKAANEKKPDRIIPCGDAEKPGVFAFEDARCC